MNKSKATIFNLLIITVLASSLSANEVEFYVNYSRKSSIEIQNDSIPVKNKKVKDKPENRKMTGSKGKITFESFDKNYERAMKYYKNQQWLSAARLFEELYPLSIGTPASDTILFSFADCYFQNHDYELSAFHYKEYTRRFPGTQRTQDAAYRCVEAIYNISPTYSLDQTETKYAIEEIVHFVQQYPYSNHVEKCNILLDEMRNKLAKKDFEVAKLYYNTENYDAAQIAIKNFLKEYPDSPLTPESMMLLVQNNYKYAKKSIKAKQRERYLDCLSAYDALRINYPDSPFVAQVKPIIDDVLKKTSK
ncbi:MAG: outer membrane protein assembly factor BamD [Bacteroidales bacterium]|jgi:outer membrane protein assembly factor BamD|nr:outer membrane protein assembly factor BamD [Bacteroidales bacterium]